jgi:hypothetical protein
MRYMTDIMINGRPLETAPVPKKTIPVIEEIKEEKKDTPKIITKEKR